MVSQAYNLVWLSPKFAQEGAEFREPIPHETFENIQFIASRNPAVDIRLWIDSKRLTALQMDWIETMVSRDVLRNFSIQDLRRIREYDDEPLFSQSEDSADWRTNKHSLIWRVVDAARILASLQGEHDQSFYSDADIINLVINDDRIQEMLSTHGFIVSVIPCDQSNDIENQAFGFNRDKRDAIRFLYQRTLEDVQLSQRNGYDAFIDFIRIEILESANITLDQISFQPLHNGTRACDPDVSSQDISATRIPNFDKDIWPVKDSQALSELEERIGQLVAANFHRAISLEA